ncbi:MAG: hemerythrin family protein [Defluviitaleaceae bacterium]|nr:hemerythrin family protein [Defluviitaleaceae bacterium]
MVNFTPDLETHVPKIDNQHKELFKRINEVVAMGAKSVNKEETDKTLVLLGDYIKEHFRDEEELQKKSGYPKYEWHRDQHKQYIDSFNKLKAEYTKNGPSAMFTLQLNKSIIEWIVKHIKHVDIELGKFINQK